MYNVHRWDHSYISIEKCQSSSDSNWIATIAINALEFYNIDHYAITTLEFYNIGITQLPQENSPWFKFQPQTE